MSEGTGLQWVVRNPEQLAAFIQMAHNMPLPFMGKLGPVVPPGTQSQLNYMHSLCNALAQHHHVHPDIAKRDAKAEFGIVVVHTSIVTGERTARLESFRDYTKEQRTAFITAMEAHLSENGIEFVPSE